MKFVILIAFIGIFGALASAGFFMLRKGSGDKRSPNMARALAVRVAVSVALFAILLLSWFMGWIEPTGLPVRH